MRIKFKTIFLLGIILFIVLSSFRFWLLHVTNGLYQKFFAELTTQTVTLIAAGIALYGISAQIQSNVNANQKFTKAKLDAAKAVLPIVLSNINQLCKERYFAIACGRKEKSDKWHWEITDTELLALKECIEFAVGFEKDLMLQICRIYQVLIVRWEELELEDLFSSQDLKNNNLSQIGQFNAIQNWAVLEAITSSLFNYSRGAKSNPTNDQIINLALKSMERIYTGTLNGKRGPSLRNNTEYNAYLERIKRNRNLEFVGEEWDF